MNKLVTKKYLFRHKNTSENSICVKFVTDIESEHELLAQRIKEDDDIVFCACEYVSEIDIEAMQSPVVVKTEVKQDETL